jgi:hypothetical protein
VNTDRKVPSLDDIIDARSRLKATSHWNKKLLY